MEYRYETKSIVGFVQMLASNYMPHGYWFYVTGRVPVGKNADAVDQKILAKYGIELSRQQRSRRKLQGFANLHYLRYQDFFVILATHGKHPFFEAEATSIKDIRKIPIQFNGYSLSVKRGGFLKREEGEEAATLDKRHRVRVIISREAFRNLAAYLLELATHRSAETLRWEFWNQPFEPYAPIRKQLLKVLRAVNNKRSAMGYEKLKPDFIRYKRKIVKPFDYEFKPSEAPTTYAEAIHHRPEPLPRFERRDSQAASETSSSTSELLDALG
ncbi:MAG: hypothetical protein SGI77_02955 [Pirellulaceae bacterium]|nr:hypothetical protein [Pirellulaceae bacterium]